MTDGLQIEFTSQVTTNRWCSVCGRNIARLFWLQCSICQHYNICHHCEKERLELEHLSRCGGSLIQVSYRTSKTELLRQRFQDLISAKIELTRESDLRLVLEEVVHNKQYDPEAAQIIFQYLRRAASDNQIRILSIDGGGIRGYMTLFILQTVVERCFQGDFRAFTSSINYFVGTSIGALIAFCLCVNYDFDQIVLLFRESRQLFKQNSFLWVFSSWYDCGVIHERLNTILEEKWNEVRAEQDPDIGDYNSEEFTLGFLDKYFLKSNQNSRIRALIINAYDCTAKSVCIFNSNYRGHRNYRVLDILKATMAAPILFPVYKEMQIDSIEHTLIDGGVYANNPELTGIWAAYLDTNRANSYYILSIGTGAGKSRFIGESASGCWDWIVRRKLFDIITDANGFFSQTLAKHLASSRSMQRFRFNCRFEEEAKSLDPLFPSKFDTVYAKEISESEDLQALLQFMNNIFKPKPPSSQ